MILIKLCQFLKIVYKIETPLSRGFSEAEAIILNILANTLKMSSKYVDNQKSSIMEVNE